MNPDEPDPKKPDPDQPVDPAEAKRARGPLHRAVEAVINLGIAVKRVVTKR
jgi:hypothetical protein